MNGKQLVDYNRLVRPTFTLTAIGVLIVLWRLPDLAFRQSGHSFAAPSQASVDAAPRRGVPCLQHPQGNSPLAACLITADKSVAQPRALLGFGHFAIPRVLAPEQMSFGFHIKVGTES